MTTVEGLVRYGACKGLRPGLRSGVRVVQSNTFWRCCCMIGKGRLWDCCFMKKNVHKHLRAQAGQEASGSQDRSLQAGYTTALPHIPIPSHAAAAPSSLGNRTTSCCCGNYQRSNEAAKAACAAYTRHFNSFHDHHRFDPPRIAPSVCLVKADPAEGFATNAVVIGTVRAAAESIIARPGGAMIVRVS